MKALNLVLIAAILLAACKKEARVAPEPKPFATATAAVAAMDKDTIPDKSGLKLKLYQDSTISDETFIIFNHVSSPDYVFNEDAPYLNGFGHVNIANISRDGTDLAISSLPYSTGMSIGLDIHTKSSGSFFLRISGLYKMPADKQIWLKDNLQKDSIDLRLGNYGFKVDEADINSFGKKRFVLIIK